MRIKKNKRNIERDIIGRESELAHLESFYKTDSAKLIVMYGRRRVGKSFLIKHFVRTKPSYYFDGIEDGVLQDQLEHISNQLFIQTNDPMLRGFNPKNWLEFFDILLTVIRNHRGSKKIVIIFDEIQWLASGRTKLISILKSYWDNHFINENILFILCGSVAHYVVRKIIRSKSLYGRISSQILLQQLEPGSARKMLKKRGNLEALKYIMLFGGVPKYLEEINVNISFDQNIENLCFKATGFFNGEIEKIFFSQFKEAKVYKKIVELLCERSLSLEDLSKRLKMKSGGGLKEYLTNLEMAQFIRSNPPLLNMNRKDLTYRTVDEFLRFHHQYLKKMEFQIQANLQGQIFRDHVKPIWNSWLGLAFENFCIKNAFFFAMKMGFSSQVVRCGALLVRHQGCMVAQFDLVYERNDSVITLCEIKWTQKPVEISVISEVESKIARSNLASLCKIKNFTIEKVLIAPMGVSSSLKKSRYFNHIVSIDEIL